MNYSKLPIFKRYFDFARVAQSVAQTYNEVDELLCILQADERRAVSPGKRIFMCISRKVRSL